MDKEKNVPVVLLGAVAIEGELYTRGASLSVPEDLAKSLFERGKASMPKTSEAAAALDDRTKKLARSAKDKAPGPAAKDKE